MGLLPENKKVKHSLSDKIAIWVMGAAGEGKTTFASSFPNAFMINTDGNYYQFDTPSVFIQETMEYNGKVIHGFEYIELLIEEFIAQKGKKGGYQTLVIDLLEDVIKLCDKMVARQNGKEFAQDIPWGKGNKMVAEKIKALTTKLNSLDMNVVYLSHVVQAMTKDLNGNDIIQYIPKEIKPEWTMLIAGRCQVVCLLETVEVNAEDEDGNLIYDGKNVVKEKFKILNWEKSERVPTVVIRFKTLASYCLADYTSLMETLER